MSATGMSYVLAPQDVVVAAAAEREDVADIFAVAFGLCFLSCLWCLLLAMI